MNLKKKIFIIIIFIVITVLLQNTVFAEELNIYSPTAVLMDANSGEILYDKFSGYPMFPASTTKVLTAIIAIENSNLDDKVTANPDAVNSIKSGYTNANIQPGETLTMRDLLYALLLKSANEAANIIAEHISGSVDNFAVLMNEKASEIGCKTTHFINANGIHNDDHYTTAEDLAIITRYAMQNKTFRKIFCAKEYTLPATEQYPSDDRILKNTNSLMHSDSPYYYPYAIAGKTGFTTQAKNCLICVSQKDGLELISVVLHAESTEDGKSARYQDTLTLLEYGNNNYTSHTILDKNAIVNTIEIDNASKETKKLNIIAENRLAVTVPNIDKPDLSQLKITIDNNIQAPITKGTAVGTATFSLYNHTYTTNLIAETDVELPAPDVPEQTKNIPTIDFIVLGIVIIAIIIFVVLKNRVIILRLNSGD